MIRSWTFRKKIAQKPAPPAQAPPGVPVLSIVTQPQTTAQSGVAFTGVGSVRLKDAQGNNLAIAGVIVNPVMNESGTFQPNPVNATTDSNGVVTWNAAVITGTVGAKTLTYTALLGVYTPVTSNAINLTPGLASPANSTASVPSGTVGVQTVITVQAKDSANNNLTVGGESVTGSINSGSANFGTPITTTDNSNGTYSLRYTPAASGTDTIAINMNGVAISGSPFTSSVPSSSGTLIVNSDFERGSNLSLYGFNNVTTGSSNTIYSNTTKPSVTPAAPDARKATHALRCRCVDLVDATDPSNIRAQLAWPQSTPLVKNNIYWYAFSWWFPTNFPVITTSFNMCGELYTYGAGQGSVEGGVPPVAFYVHPSSAMPQTIEFNTSRSTVDGNTTAALLPRPLGQWIDILIHFKMHDDPTLGWVELWHRAVPNIASPPAYNNIALTGGVTQPDGASRLACRTMKSTWLTSAKQWFINNYRRNSMRLGDTSIYYDECKIGTTREIVEP